MLVPVVTFVTVALVTVFLPAVTFTAIIVPTMVLVTTLVMMALVPMTSVLVFPVPASEGMSRIRRANHQDSHQKHQGFCDRLHLRMPLKKNHRVLRKVLRRIGPRLPHR